MKKQKIKIRGSAYRSIILILFLILTQTVFAQDSYTIAGLITCECEECGTLYIFLVNEESFGIPLTGLQEKNIQVTGISRSYSFSFTDVPPGIYGIRCFIDTNKNHKLDSGLFGPSEPWGMSFQKERFWGIPGFNDVAFTVNSDVHNLKIKVKK